MSGRHRTPATPAEAVCVAGLADYAARAVQHVWWEYEDTSASVWLTRTYIADWEALSLTPADSRQAIQACILVAHHRSHPLLPIAQCTNHSTVSLMCPVPGLTIAFRPHWSRPDDVVFLAIASA